MVGFRKRPWNRGCALRTVVAAFAVLALTGCAKGASDATESGDELDAGGDGNGSSTGGTGTKTGGTGPATGGVGPTGGVGGATGGAGGTGGASDASADGSADGATGDAATDASVDAGVDAGADAGVDAGTDSGTPPTGTTTFGGAYSMEKTDSCPMPHNCHTANPLVAGGTTCGCPAGFTSTIGPFHHLDDRNGPGLVCDVANDPYGWATSYVCYGGTFDAATADFGGAYHKGENGTCYVGNPMNGNACTCPAGSQAIELIADGGCWENSKIGLCWNGTAPRTSFGGAYLASDSASYGTSGCVVANPATGACSCPADCTNISIRSIYGPNGMGPCNSSGAFGAHLNICRKL
jgi:hypothetical protein